MGTGFAFEAKRAEGRLFSKGGHLHYVLGVDGETGVARVSCRIGTETEIVEMPIEEVLQFLGVSSRIKLDGLSAPATAERVVRKDEKWFFQAREGDHGPYESEEGAHRALKQHILAAQEEGRTGRPAA